MPTVATSIDIAECTCIADVASNKRYSLHNVSMNHLLITDQRHVSHAHAYKFVYLASFSSYYRPGHVPENRNRADFCACPNSKAILVTQPTVLKH